MRTSRCLHRYLSISSPFLTVRSALLPCAFSGREGGGAGPRGGDEGPRVRIPFPPGWFPNPLKLYRVSLSEHFRAHFALFSLGRGGWGGMRRMAGAEQRIDRSRSPWPPGLCYRVALLLLSSPLSLSPLRGARQRCVLWWIHRPRWIPGTTVMTVYKHMMIHASTRNQHLLLYSVFVSFVIIRTCNAFSTVC